MTSIELNQRVQAWRQRQVEMAAEAAQIKAAVAAQVNGNGNAAPQVAQPEVPLHTQHVRFKHQLVQRPDIVKRRARRLRNEYSELDDPKPDEFKNHGMVDLLQDSLGKLLLKSGLGTEHWWPSERDLRLISLFLSADKANLAHHRNHQLRLMAQHQLRLQKARDAIDISQLLNPASNPASRRLGPETQQPEGETVVVEPSGSE